MNDKNNKPLSGEGGERKRGITRLPAPTVEELKAKIIGYEKEFSVPEDAAADWYYAVKQLEVIPAVAAQGQKDQSEEWPEWRRLAEPEAYIKYLEERLRVGGSPARSVEGRDISKWLEDHIPEPFVEEIKRSPARWQSVVDVFAALPGSQPRYLKLLRWFKLFYGFYQKDIVGQPSACASALSEDAELQEFVREADTIK